MKIKYTLTSVVALALLSTFLFLLERSAPHYFYFWNNDIKLAYAVENEEVASIERLLEKGADPSYRDLLKKVSSRYMADDENERKILALLAKYSSSESLNKALPSAIHRAYVDNVKILVNYGANVNARIGEKTPLSLATKCIFDKSIFEPPEEENCLLIAEFLIHKGAQIHEENTVYKGKIISPYQYSHLYAEFVRSIGLSRKDLSYSQLQFLELLE